MPNRPFLLTTVFTAPHPCADGGRLLSVPGPANFVRLGTGQPATPPSVAKPRKKQPPTLSAAQGCSRLRGQLTTWTAETTRPCDRSREDTARAKCEVHGRWVERGRRSIGPAPQVLSCVMLNGPGAKWTGRALLELLLRKNHKGSGLIQPTATLTRGGRGYLALPNPNARARRRVQRGVGPPHRTFLDASFVSCTARATQEDSSVSQHEPRLSPNDWSVAPRNLTE
jgi:hypothetical protein